MIAADRLFEITDLGTKDSSDRTHVVDIGPGDIVFEGVVFKYNHRIKILDGFSAKIRSGEITAIVGDSGSGKSTLLQLLLRTYCAQEGSISIGGMNIEYVSEESLRQLFAIVPQKVELFSGTVIDNIALGERNADLARIMELISLLQMEEFIDTLDNGLDHFIEESGNNLSGGQKQRIAIARALYRDPEILLLDEPAASLDKEAEKALINAITHRKRAGKTVVIVSHKPSAIAAADHMLTLSGGKLLSHEAVDKRSLGRIQEVKSL
jgi:ATP-binding cassette subfamily B protein